MRPGAQLFVDFGWDTNDLYNPEKLLRGEGPDYDKDKGNNHSIEDCLYSEKTFIKLPTDEQMGGKYEGFDGYVTQSKGQLETIIGVVTDYSSTINDDGTVTCQVEITSKNSALMSYSGFDEEQRITRMETLLDTTILYNALFLHHYGIALSGK